MKIIATLILIFLSIQINGQSLKTDKLKVALTSLKKDNNLKNQNTFFDLFPNSFESFKNTFGFEDGKEAPLYDGFDYVQAFFQLDSIKENRQIDKWIDISINGQWEADAVNYFQHNLRPRIFKNIDLTYELLKKRTDIEIISFFYFFFNEIHPQYESIPSEFEKIGHRDKKFYELIRTGHKRAIKESGH